MKAILLAVATLALTACSTAGGSAGAAPEDSVIDDAWIERNGPSEAPREGWQQTVSGWYRSGKACLRYQEKVTAGTSLAAGEGCLEPGI